MGRLLGIQHASSNRSTCSATLLPTSDCAPRILAPLAFPPPWLLSARAIHRPEGGGQPFALAFRAPGNHLLARGVASIRPTHPPRKTRDLRFGPTASAPPGRARAGLLPHRSHLHSSRYLRKLGHEPNPIGRPRPRKRPSCQAGHRAWPMASTVQPRRDRTNRSRPARASTARAVRTRVSLSGLQPAQLRVGALRDNSQGRLRLHRARLQAA